jgi:2-C-methyl-D-erythritol 2,4-cyclodiphosphate synthase
MDGKERVRDVRPVFGTVHDEQEQDDDKIRVQRSKKTMNFRIGHGYDVHRFVKNRKLVLGGIEIRHNKGLLGHSDADVMLHAVSDAILGAAGLGDIGQHFPNRDPKYKNISSRIILGEVIRMCAKKKFRISNIDVTLIGEQPKISPYYDKMKQVISAITGTRNVNIKATTNEKMGFIGRNEGLACFAVVLIVTA